MADWRTNIETMGLRKSAAMLDIETINLARGSGIHEVALYDFAKNKVWEYLPSPHHVAVDSPLEQEYTQLASHGADQFKYIERGTWEDVIVARMSMQYGKDEVVKQELQAFLKEREPFLAKTRERTPHLRGQTYSLEEIRNRSRQLGTMGIESELAMKADMQDLLRPGSDFMNRMKGKVVYGANVAFESSQVGSVIGAMEAQGQKVGLRDLVEHQSPDNPNLLYTTGESFNRARYLAQVTGDWTKLYGEYAKTKPIPGRVVVRDLLDLPKMLYSFGYKLGMTHVDNPIMGTSVEVVSRLLRPDLPEEAHRAVDDASIHQRVILEEMDQLLPAMNEAMQGTEKGKALMKQARRGEGPLAQVAGILKARQHMAPQIQRAGFAEQITRAYIDIRTGALDPNQTGKAWLSDFKKRRQIKQVKYSGEEFKIPVLMSHRKGLDSLDEVMNHIRGWYPNLDVEAEYASFKKEVGSVKDAIGWREANKSIDWSKARRVAESGYLGLPGGKLPFQLGRVNVRGVGIGIAAGAAGLGLLGAALSGGSSRKGQRPNPQSLVTYDYEQWLAHQREYYGLESSNKGLRPGGIAGQNRHANTDFGSPYQGPIVSNQVMMQQELLKHRERKLREAYGAIHRDINLFAPFKLLGPSHHRFVSDGVSVTDYKGTQGELKKISSENYKITAEDADTIVVKRRGMLGLLHPSFKFRLAGIDSPETRHAMGPGAKTAQPHAYKSTRQLEEYIKKGENLEVIFDPNSVSYGRMMASLVIDDKNINYDLVKKGLAAHLPYERAEEAMVNYEAMAQAERRGFNAHRGMWAQPWARAFYESQMGSDKRVTFNSLANPMRVAENSDAMSMLSLMQQAQAQGQYNTADSVAAASVAKNFDIGSDIPAPRIHAKPNASFVQYMDHLKGDTTSFMQTRGQKGFKRHSRGNYGDLDKALSIDSLNTTSSPWNIRRPYAYDQYPRVKQQRRQMMARSQRAALRDMNESPIGHHRM